MLRALSRNPRPTLLLTGRMSLALLSEHHSWVRVCNCPALRQVQKNTKYNRCVGTRIAPPLQHLSRKDRQTRAHGVGSMACISPNLDLAGAVT